MLKIVENDTEEKKAGLGLTLDELAREGARRMLLVALEAEVESYIEAHRGERDGRGRALVVRNGKAQARKVTLGCGTVEVQAPRVNDKRVDAEGNRQRFTSKILPPYMRRSPKVAEVLPVLYLRGLSTGDFSEALPVLLGKDAAGLSATNITRMTAAWDKEHKQFCHRSLKDKDYVYIWVDGVHVNIRLGDDRLCMLVVLGVRPDGTKELVAIDDGYRESKESWLTLLRDLKRRGMRAPALAIGDGALGFWGALRDVWPEARRQRCWFHRLGNVLDKLPKRLQAKAKRALHEIMNAENKAAAEEAVERFEDEYGARYPKALAALTRDRDSLLTFFDFPADHWRHIRTTNAIESPFATVKLRTRVTKGAGSRTKGLLMGFKLLTMAQRRWRRITGAKYLPLVRAGVRFVDGVQIERDETNIEEENAA